MDKPASFEVVEDYAVFRPTGQVSLDQLVRLVTSAIASAREQHIRKLLVNTIGLTSFEPPGVGKRYFSVHDWAEAARGVVNVAVVARPEMIHPERFGVTVAGNVMFVSKVFASEDEALAWLQGL